MGSLTLRLLAAIKRIESTDTPWYERGLFWGCFGTALALSLTGIGFGLTGDLAVAGWLLLAAWPFASIAAWCACTTIQSRRLKLITAVSLVVASGLALLGSNNWLVNRHDAPLQLIFKDSPSFTSSRKKLITHEMTLFHRYLTEVGFDVPRDVPPIGTVPGSDKEGNPPILHPSYGDSMLISQGDLDNPAAIRHLYTAYAFNKIFRVLELDDLSRPILPQLVAKQPRIGASVIFSYYFSSDYSGSVQWHNNNLYGKWLDALWDMRRELDRTFTNHMLVFTQKYFNDVSPVSQAKYQFDIFFKERLERGVSAADDNAQHLGQIEDVLRRHGL